MEIRPLTSHEMERFEQAETNEARCNANGTFFNSYDIEQEGLWIMGVGHYGNLQRLSETMKEGSDHGQ